MVLLASAIALRTFLGCSADAKSGANDGSGDEPSAGSGGSETPPDGGLGDGGNPYGNDAAADGGDGSVGSGEPCASTSCNPGQRCERDGAAAKCVDKSCADLQCGEDERCAVHALGGHVCVADSCNADVECPADAHCADHHCKPDVCSAGARVCHGQSVFECSSNGGEELSHFSCDNSTSFDSKCVEPTAGQATCTCLDDWDCPAFTICETGTCQGTGVAASCSLPPIPFSDTPPAVEVQWGGQSQANSKAFDGTAAHAEAPWSKFGQVLDTPIVANLDDDNGDGLINELDFPEILFIAHEGNNAWSNGVVRAIHGGGPNKGADYFARCGTKLWTRAKPSAEACADGDPDGDSGAPVAVGDLDNDGVPEIVYTTESNTFRILSNTGELKYTLSKAWTSGTDGETVAIANLDYSGYAEILVGQMVYVLGPDGAAGSGGIKVTHMLKGNGSLGSNDNNSSMVCPADVIPSRPGQEIVAGATLYGMPATLPTCATPPCDGTLETVWDAHTIAGDSSITGQGFCAVADVWGSDFARAPGPDNKPDGKPEVILIDQGDLTIISGETGVIIDDRNLGGGDRGGAPNVDDFDGDGYMEVGSALRDFYTVVDLQDPTPGTTGSCSAWTTVIARLDLPNGAHNPNPKRNPGGTNAGGDCSKDADCDAAAVCNLTIGQCVCLHNGWRRDSDDDSSKATSSSVFDFNGDGSAEAIYNDECDFRVYDGRSGEVLFSQLSRSRTGIENPVVADVDNDGNAEVVTGMNTAVNGRCDYDAPAPNNGVPQGPNGIRVWGDPSDTWVSARRIWNQQSYSVTNVTESGAIPEHAPDSWRSWGGRVYNTYRSQPRSYGVAPDLTVVGVGVSSPGAQCGTLSDNIDIAFEIKNEGDLRVGPGVAVRFFGSWGNTEEELKNGSNAPLEVKLTQSLEPGHSVVLTSHFAEQNNQRDTLPEKVRVVVDPSSGSQPNGAERECHEDNNARTAAVDPGKQRPDLAVEIGTIVIECPDVKVPTTVRNMGSASAQH
ncbi:MAG: hypothetical protein RL701_205, partial [Pseudomonadota bacterium]